MCSNNSNVLLQTIKMNLFWHNCKRGSVQTWKSQEMRKNWCYQDYHYISSLCSFWQHEWTLKQKHNLSEAYIAVFNCWRMFVQFDIKGQYLILLNLQETMRPLTLWAKVIDQRIVLDIYLILYSSIESD
jgi:hypothetical protein